MTRDEVNAGVTAALQRLDGSAASLVSLISDLTEDGIAEVGGMPETSSPGFLTEARRERLRAKERGPAMVLPPVRRGARLA